MMKTLDVMCIQFTRQRPSRTSKAPGARPGCAGLPPLTRHAVDLLCCDCTLRDDKARAEAKKSDKLIFAWWQYEEAGTYAGRVFIDNAYTAKAIAHIPTGAGGTQIHLILEVRDENPIASLRDYRRVVVDVGVGDRDESAALRGLDRGSEQGRRRVPGWGGQDRGTPIAMGKARIGLVQRAPPSGGRRQPSTSTSQPKCSATPARRLRTSAPGARAMSVVRRTNTSYDVESWTRWMSRSCGARRRNSPIVCPRFGRR